ncbi:MAG: ABC transporter ATP-binding protein [Bacteroidetes bacterium]|nr:ABC transporter ATP-binding protein [Bacteroidota bacterium]
MSEIAISANNLTKKYGEITAVNGLSFEIKKAELFGFIGPDGAGKTTLFRILSTLLLPDSGNATLAGFDVVNDYKKIRNIIGYMPGRFSLYQDLSVEENLKFFATIFGTTIKENYELIKDIYIQIEPFKTRPAGKLSGGMKQKLALCCALIHKPEVLVLDEPTTGVDAVSRKEFWEMLKRLKESGITIIVSTPYMDEAGLCDRVSLIQGGNIMSTDTPANIIKAFNKTLFAVKSHEMYRLMQDLHEWDATETTYLFGQHIHLTIQKGNKSEIAAFLTDKQHKEVEIQEIEPNIEDSFMRLMSKH